MLKEGFQEVYHLRGGILKYLESMPPEDSLWQGECFVFDGRVTVTHGLEQGTYKLCHTCRHPVSEEQMRSPYYQEDLFCPRCHDQLSPQKRASVEERKRQIELTRLRLSAREA
jgi:UPF0176 protein